MTSNEAFANYSRSQAFGLSLSAAMAKRLVVVETMRQAALVMADLGTRYDWYRPHGIFACFGDPIIDGTERALLRRGLLALVDRDSVDPDVNPIVHPFLGVDTIEPNLALVTTEAGRLVAELLVVAGFEAPDLDRYVQKVEIHLDDRPAIRFEPPSAWTGSTDPTYIEHRVDRRVAIVDANPGDERWMETLRRTTGAPT